MFLCVFAVGPLWGSLGVFGVPLGGFGDHFGKHFGVFLGTCGSQNEAKTMCFCIFLLKWSLWVPLVS